VVGKGEGGGRGVWVLADHGDVFAFSDDRESEGLKCAEDAGFGGVDRELGHWSGDLFFDDEGVEDLRVVVEDVGAEGFDVEADGGAAVGEGLFGGVALPDDGPLEAEGVGDEPVGVLFDDDLHG
jgi:hypothetical protein